MMEYDFNERRKMSMESCQLETDMATLKAYFPDVQDVKKTDTETDKTGIDYIVTLESGVEIGVDVKTRDKGCSKFWQQGPEVALEVWSQKWPDGSLKENRLGWTVDSKKHCHYIMFKFDVEDCKTVYILPFQQLNKAFRRNMKAWYGTYRHAKQKQKTAGYVSECVFVPAVIVTEAVKQEFLTELAS